MKPSSPATVDALDDALLRAIAARGSVQTFPARTIIINEGECADTFYVLISGKVKIFGADASGNQVVYGTLGKGEYVGEMTLDGGIRVASVMTLERTTCAVVSGADLRDFITAHPDFALNLIHKLIRVARTSLSRERGGVLQVDAKLTQKDIAERIGSSREMVSRIVRELVKGGYIAVEPGKLTILRKLPARW